MRIKFINILILLILIGIINNCGVIDWFSTTFEEGNTMIVEGRKEIKNTKIVLRPGAKVIFKTEEKASIGGTVYEPGELIIGKGATLIAQGTPENPILFKVAEGDDNGYLTCTENSTKDSIIQYCKFENVNLDCKNYIEIYRSKFIFDKYNYINVIGGKIEYNTFEGGSDTLWLGDSIEKVKYNFIQNSERSGIVCFNIYAIIENNNILNTKMYAIANGTTNNKILAKYNYIKDCAGKVGIDTNGSQCLNVIFSNYYRTTPVPDAGCGW